MKCEGCEGPPEMVCSGMDVPPLYFCNECVGDHESSCDDISTGRATMLAVGCMVCSECDETDHHWIESFGFSAEEPTHPAAVRHGSWQECKHCPAWRSVETYLDATTLDEAQSPAT